MPGSRRPARFIIILSITRSHAIVSTICWDEHYMPKLKAAGLMIKDLREWSGKLTFTDVGALVYYLKATPWVVPGFSVETHWKYLMSLQRRLEDGEGLVFTTRRYLIQAQKISS